MRVARSCAAKLRWRGPRTAPHNPNGYFIDPFSPFDPNADRKLNLKLSFLIGYPFAIPIPIFRIFNAVGTLISTLVIDLCHVRRSIYANDSARTARGSGSGDRNQSIWYASAELCLSRAAFRECNNRRSTARLYRIKYLEHPRRRHNHFL